MFSLGKNREGCERFRDVLESSADITALPAAVQEHLGGCDDCRRMAEEVSMSRALLRKIPAQPIEPGPWFAARVMAAIAAREASVERSLEAWTVVPRFAARLTWISALALLLAGTWLYQSPKPTPKTGNESSIESLFDVTPSGPQDDAALGFERGQ